MSEEWFDLKDYPYFKRISEFVAAKAAASKHGPDILKEVDDAGPILSCVMLMVAHSGGKGSVGDMKAGLVDFTRLVKAAPDGILFDMGVLLVDLTGDENSMMKYMVDMEEAKRKGRVKDWDLSFDGRKVSLSVERKE
jgi:hypothetical protein